MSFNPQTLRTKLLSSTETADSITSTAQWILFYKRHAVAVAQLWAESVTSGENVLAQIYIANEVIQQSKNKKKAEFVAAFADVLPAALDAAYSRADLPTRDRIARVVKVWRERVVFGADEQKQIEDALSSHADAPAVHVDLRALAQKYADLQAAVPRGGNNVHKLVQDVQKELSAIQAKVDTLASTLPAAIESPDIEPLSPSGETDDKIIEPTSHNEEPETYTAKDAQASVAADAASDGDAVGYADSSEDETSATTGAPPEKKPRVDLDPKLSSFLANISKTGM